MINIKVVGPHRTGSTIVQNIGYFILNKKQGRLPKNHSYELKPNIKYLVTIRDPREMVISIYKNLIKGGIKIECIDDLEFLNHPTIKSDLFNLQKIYQSHKRNPNSLILRYEELYKEGVGNYNIVIDKITKFTNVNLTPFDIEKLNETLNYNKLKKISEEIGTFKKHDVETTGFGLHGNHISSHSINTWDKIIHQDLHNSFNIKLKKYIIDTGY